MPSHVGAKLLVMPGFEMRWIFSASSVIAQWNSPEASISLAELSGWWPVVGRHEAMVATRPQCFRSVLAIEG